MKLFGRIILVILLSTVSSVSYSQQLPLYSQYVMNGFLLNPAIAGADGFSSLNLTSRQQWLGYSEAPRTYSMSGQTRLLKRKAKAFGGKLQSSRSGNVGIGGNMFADVNGAINKTGLSGAYSYHINFRNSQLSLGLNASIIQIGIDKSKLTFDEDEPLMLQLGRNIYYPDMGVGAFWSSTKGFIGLSVDQLTQSALRVTLRDIEYKMRRQYYLIGGYNIPFGDRYDLEPSFLIKTNEKILKGDFKTSTQFDAGLKLYISKMYWAGLYYRSAYNGIYIATIGMRYNMFIVGYAYDYSASPISNSTWGSHELIIGMKFGDSARRYRWLDRY